MGSVFDRVMFDLAVHTPTQEACEHVQHVLFARGWRWAISGATINLQPMRTYRSEAVLIVRSASKMLTFAYVAWLKENHPDMPLLSAADFLGQTPAEDVEGQQHACTCDLDLLLRSGCQCGGK